MLKLSYISRIFSAYVLKRKSQVSFWHEYPEINEQAFQAHQGLGEYYMPFFQKALWNELDSDGIPLLNYHGKIGTQYNPIAIAQYGLGHCNLYLRSKKTFHLEAIIKTADWLVSHLRRNGKGLLVWFHEFDFEYFQLLKNPWYSGLAQGQAISFLLRAHEITDNQKYIQCALDASLSLQTKIEDGGVLFHDDLGGTWIEEYITHPPVHILNGFIWALWGVYDLCQTTSDARLKELYRRLEQNLCTHLERYDTGYWSRYDLSPLRLINPASRFYHQLHCIQLEIMHRLTGKEKYRLFSEKWRTYQTKRMNRISACFKKCVFKVLYY